MTRVRMTEDQGSFLQTHVNGKSTPLREVIFERAGDGVNIRFNRFVGKGDHIGAYQIPMELFLHLCAEFLEDQGYTIFDQPPDHEHYMVSGDEWEYDSFEIAKEVLDESATSADPMREIFYVQTYYDLVYTTESE